MIMINILGNIGNERGSTACAQGLFQIPYSQEYVVRIPSIIVRRWNLDEKMEGRSR